MRLEFKATLVCAVISILGTVAYMIAFGVGVTYSPGVNLDALNDMSYKDAMRYLESHGRPVSGWQTLLDSIAFGYWQGLAKYALMSFIGSPLSCLIVLRMRDRTRVIV